MFLISPVLVFFSPAFWRSLKEKGMGTGILYIFYVSAILTIIGGTFLFSVPSKKIIGLVSPYTKILPEKMAWTPLGFEINENKPFALKYDDKVFGMIDTSIDSVPPGEMSKYYVYLTKGYFYMKDDKGGYRIVPVTAKGGEGDISRVDIMLQDMGELTPALTLNVTAKSGERSFDLQTNETEALMAKTWKYILGFIIAVAGFFVFIWKFFAAILYSLLALVINAILRTKASFEKLFCVAAYAMTPLIIIQALSPFVRRISFLAGFWAGTAVVALYIFMMLISWRKKDENVVLVKQKTP